MKNNNFNLDGLDMWHVEHFAREVFAKENTAKQGATFLLFEYSYRPEHATALIKYFRKLTGANVRTINRKGIVSLYCDGERVAIQDFTK